jgi:hypothetical protein
MGAGTVVDGVLELRNATSKSNVRLSDQWYAINGDPVARAAFLSAGGKLAKCKDWCVMSDLPTKQQDGKDNVDQMHRKQRATCDVCCAYPDAANGVGAFPKLSNGAKLIRDCLWMVLIQVLLRCQTLPTVAML